MVCMTMKKLLLVSTAIFGLTTVQAQANCKEETIKKLQGVWFEYVADKDSIGVIIKNNHWLFSFTYWGKEPEYWNMKIANRIPNVDAVADCKFFALSKSPGDTLYFEIIELSDTSLRIKESISDVRSFRKIKREPKAIQEPVWGEWGDENTMITLKTDSTFTIKFWKKDYQYSSAGKFWFDGEGFVLKDSQGKGNNFPFDKNNEIHLHYTMFGLGLKETRMVLVKMD